MQPLLCCSVGAAQQTAVQVRRMARAASFHNFPSQKNQLAATIRILNCPAAAPTCVKRSISTPLSVQPLARQRRRIQLLLPGARLDYACGCSSLPTMLRSLVCIAIWRALALPRVGLHFGMQPRSLSVACPACCPLATLYKRIPWDECVCDLV